MNADARSSRSPIRKKLLGEYAISAPSLAWLIFFFLLPTLIIFAIAFRSKGAYGGIGDSWTLTTLAELRNPDYPAIIWRTVWMSVVCTLATLAIAVPVAYHIARVSQWKRDLLLLLTIIPEGIDGTIEVMADRPWASQRGITLGKVDVKADMTPGTPLELAIPLPGLSGLTAKHAVFFKFTSAVKEKSLCSLENFVFSAGQ